MAVRIRYRIEVAVSSTSAEERDLVNAQYEVYSDDYDEGGVRKFTLAVGVSDQQIDIGNIADVSFLMIRTNAKDPNLDPNEVTFKLNSAVNEARTIKPLTNTKEGHQLLSTESLTALYMSNAGPADMEITVVTVGD